MALQLQLQSHALPPPPPPPQPLPPFMPRALPHLRMQAKSTRDSFLQVFPEVFDALFRLCSDADTNVQNAASFLDNLCKVRVRVVWWGGLPA